MAEEVVLMKGNEAIAHAAIRCGADGYFGYPTYPSIRRYWKHSPELKPWETTGMVVFRQRVKWQLSIWYTVAPEAEKW